MKILVLSDTHGDTAVIELLLAREKPDALIHLGDCSGDVQYALICCDPALCEGVKLFQVCGNCDGYTQLPAELEAEIGGKRFFLLHGHTRDVKNGDAALLSAARAREVEIILYGHTHVARNEEKDGVRIVNPGSARRRTVFGRNATYAVLAVQGETVTAEIKPVL
ncbi:MAG: metallophosphoesterase [Clostridia bacterium]|nr:metallophosphoesterase [Clostridia bacterium]